MSSLLQVQEDDHQAAQAKIWEIVYGFADSLVLRSAVELGIVDIIQKHGSSINLTELESQISVNSLINVSCLYRIMRYLVHMKLFSIGRIDGQLRYQLEPVAKLLVKWGEQSMAPSILMILDKDYMAPWHLFKDCFWGDGTTAFEKASGRSIWNYMAGNPEKNQLFNEVMACDSRLLTPALISGCKEIFDGIGSRGGTRISSWEANSNKF